MAENNARKANSSGDVRLLKDIINRKEVKICMKYANLITELLTTQNFHFQWRLPGRLSCPIVFEQSSLVIGVGGKKQRWMLSHWLRVWWLDKRNGYWCQKETLDLETKEVIPAKWPMHYRLRPIKEVQFGFAHFVSHFICIQIFQIDFPLILSASKYFR